MLLGIAVLRGHTFKKVENRWIKRKENNEYALEEIDYVKITLLGGAAAE